MAREQDKPLTKTEMKMLIFNKVKLGMDYKKAVKEVEKIADICMKNHKKTKKKPFKFSEEFKKLTK